MTDRGSDVSFNSPDNHRADDLERQDQPGAGPFAGTAGLIPALDGFRAIAILIVVLSHVGLEHWVPGQFGVTLFFFLSGYLIATLLRAELQSHGYIHLGRFYLRRVIRIIPPMWIAITLAMVFSRIGLNRPLNQGWLPFDFAFLSNYFPFSGVPIGLWSLAVEEHFYLVFPVVAGLAFTRGGLRNVIALCLIGCMAALALRYGAIASGARPYDLTFLTHTRIDSILFGALLALWNNPVLDPRNRISAGPTGYLIGAAILLVTFAVRDEYFRQTLRFTLQGMGLFVIFNAAIRDRGWAGQLLDSWPLRLIASLSYVIYLVHGIFIEAAKVIAPGLGTVFSVASGLAATFVFAYAARQWLERPLARWRRALEQQWFRSPVRSATAGDVPLP